MRILALDTATENCSAALFVDGSVVDREAELERGHAERILSMIDGLLADASLTLAGLDAIAFGRGPGSFTGVRLAASITQGLAFGADRGVIPISDLRAIAQRMLGLDATATRVLVCNDARMHEVYWACFERGPDGLAVGVGEEHVDKPETVALPQPWRQPHTPSSGPQAIAGAGRGFAVYSELRALIEDPHAIHNGLLPRATEIALLAVPELRSGRLVSPELALPVYLRNNVVHSRQSGA